MTDESSHPGWGLNLPKTAYHFVTLSIEEAPETVGYPINMLTIRRDGTYSWQAPNEYCYGSPKESPPPPTAHH
jgi:hypothetical protein